MIVLKSDKNLYNMLNSEMIIYLLKKLSLLMISLKFYKE